MNPRLHILFAALAIVALSAGCSSKPTLKLQGDDEVLAKVNGTAISRYDLDLALRDNLSQRSLASLDDQGRKTMLQSLARGRAIAQAEDKTLSAERRAEIDKKVAAYREELLVKYYLAERTSKTDVTDDMIRDYYEQNPERFGASRVRSYELLTSAAEPSPAERPKLIEALGKLERERDWQAAANKLNKAGHAVRLAQGKGDEATLHPKLAQLIAQLPVAGASSQLLFLEGRPYIVRVTAEARQPPRPLAEVRREIRATLLPVQLKQAVQQASDQVLKDAEVAYR
jgi:hypothetical protein